MWTQFIPTTTLQARYYWDAICRELRPESLSLWAGQILDSLSYPRLHQTQTHTGINWGSCWKPDSDSVDLGKRMTTYIFNKFQEGAEVAGPQSHCVKALSWWCLSILGWNIKLYIVCFKLYINLLPFILLPSSSHWEIHVRTPPTYTTP